MIVVLKQVLQGKLLEELEAKVAVLDAVDNEEIFVILIPDSPAKAHLLNPFFFGVCYQKFVIIGCSDIKITILILVESLALTSVRLGQRCRQVVFALRLAHIMILFFVTLKILILQIY